MSHATQVIFTFNLENGNIHISTIKAGEKKTSFMNNKYNSVT